MTDFEQRLRDIEARIEAANARADSLEATYQARDDRGRFAEQRTPEQQHADFLVAARQKDSHPEISAALTNAYEAALFRARSPVNTRGNPELGFTPTTTRTMPAPRPSLSYPDQY